MRIAKALLGTEMDCWKVSQVQDSGGSWRDWVCCRFTAGKGLKESTKAQIPGEDGQLILTPYAPEYKNQEKSNYIEL